MHDLKIQAANKPADDAIVGSKIGSRDNLVNGPFSIDFIGYRIGLRELGIFNDMCQLEHDADGNATNKNNDGISDDGWD